MYKKFYLYLIVIGLFSCNFLNQDTKKLLVTVNGDKLYFSDIEHLLSPDLSRKDSLKLIRSLSEKWAIEQLFVQKAKVNLPVSQQNVKSEVENYEKSLLIYYYQKELLNQKLDTIINSYEVNSFYENNKSNFILNKSVARLNFIKLKKEVPNLFKFKNFYNKKDEESRLLLEDYCYQFADDFYIEDKWFFVDEIFEIFPHSFSFKKINKGKSIEAEDDDYYYFLFIKNYISKGNVSPLEMVISQIHSIIINKRKLSFLKQIEKEIYENAIVKNHVKFEKY